MLRQLPCLFMFLLGLFMWLNFLSINAMYIYWPVVLIGVTVIILFLPVRLLYHRSRKWWAYSNWRLLLAGFYPVEFRDFFLGDMYCSQTYAMGVKKPRSFIFVNLVLKLFPEYRTLLLPLCPPLDRPCTV
ncbi:EXS family-domain-containing protein [Aspergillus avenaceus]|uniref:EXS family-domain-containing protein n=1 Tax=Aspergillus avenaceus TaxID=36643 RepID=A0A5N6TYD6_ASPAV|nr:EXS family-domain-containing protein [Aspergillus avenaceus]